MIRRRLRACTIDDELFSTTLAIIVKSEVAKDIRSYAAESSRDGGRRPAGITYTVEAVLVALLIRFRMGRPYSTRGALDTIGEFTATQLAMIGMDGQDLTRYQTDTHASYKAFAAWWARRLAPIDPHADVPAQRMTNAQFKALIASRSDRERERAQRAQERLTSLVNRLLAASVTDPTPANCVGDVVVDETTITTAGPDGTLGARDDRRRGATALGAYWARNEKGKLEPGAKRQVKSHGFGIGVTCRSRVARRDALHSEPVVFIGIAVHEPTGASIAALATVLEQARRNGVDARRDGRSRQPQVIADMGYNMKRGFGNLMVTTGYMPVIRYPSDQQLKQPSVVPPGSDGPPPGPIQFASAFFCPAVPEAVLHKHRAIPSAELLKRDQFKAHDDRLRRLYPYLMGTNSRLEMAPVRRGRPRHGETAQMAAKIRLVCPAELGTVRCPLKVESLKAENPAELPLAQPRWPAEAMGCCSKASVTVTLTERQLQMAQPGLVAGSVEHMTYYEAGRSLTEQRFGLFKSRCVAALDRMTTGPRRTPMVTLAAALAAVTVNIEAQRDFDPKKVRDESINRQMRKLAHHLGYEPVRMPPRT